MALSTALKNILDSRIGIGNTEELASAVDSNTTFVTGVTATVSEINVLAGSTAGNNTASLALISGSNKQLNTLAVGSLVSGNTATPGSAGQAITVINRKAAVADAAATSIFTVTCPNSEQAAVVEVILLAAVKKTSGATLESARVAVGYVVFDRTTGAVLVGFPTTLTNTGIATSGTDTLTLAYSLSAASGANGATQTMDIKVTCTGSGTDTHNVTALATIINSEASGMTIASV